MGNKKDTNTPPVLILDETIARVPSKADIADASVRLVERVDEGYMNPLLAYGQLTALEQVVKAAKERIADQALEEAQRYEKEGTIPFGAFGCDFQVKESGVKYDFSDNARWRELKEANEITTAELKSHEDLLKRMKMCAKSSKTIVQVTLHKM